MAEFSAWIMFIRAIVRLPTAGAGA
jgi:hypothetical protein